MVEQKLVAELFQCSSDTVSLHLKNIFKDGELEKRSVTEEFSVTARRVTRVKLMRSLNVRTRSQKDKAMYDTHLKYGYTLKEIAEYIGIHYTIVSRAIKKSRGNMFRYKQVVISLATCWKIKLWTKKLKLLLNIKKRKIH